MILYLDTSSLLKLFVLESGTEEVQARVEGAGVVATSIIAYPEAHAALARRQREGAWMRAGALAIRHRLRGMDAIHLASYVERLGRGDPLEFLSHDAQLMRAATRERRGQRRP